MRDNYSETPYGHEYSSNDHGLSTPAAFLVGAAMGFVGALLLAPQSGRKTRGQIRQKTNHLNNVAQGRLEQAKNVTQDLSERAKNKVNRGMDKADQAEDQGRQAARKISRNDDEL